MRFQEFRGPLSRHSCVLVVGQLESASPDGVILSLRRIQRQRIVPSRRLWRSARDPSDDARYVGATFSLSAEMSDERLKGNPIAAFLDQIELVGLDIRERLFQAAGPPDLDGVGASGFAQAKIGA